MELGNLFFGNSRGPIPFPDRELVNSSEWHILGRIIGIDEYGCAIEKKRPKNIVENEHGGISLVKDDKIIFTISPYWWGDCTCGAEERNMEIEEKIKRDIFTEDEFRIYEDIGDFCEDTCPAFDLDIEDDEKLLAVCTCGMVKKNIKMKKKKEALKDKIEEFEKRLDKECVEHDEICMLIKHNFIFHPGMEDEFWIDWYKYPFRDSFMNKKMSEEDIKKVWQTCINELRG